MEKTIFYSNVVNHKSAQDPWQQYKNCEHSHCSILMRQINRLTNNYKDNTQTTLLKDSKKTNNSLQKQNKPHSTSSEQIYEQIQVLKQNYWKAMKLLEHFQKQNDQLFEENQKLKVQLKKIKQKNNFDKKNSLLLQYSETRYSDNIDIDGKQSFYTETTQRVDHQQNLKEDDEEELNFTLTPLDGSNFLQQSRSKAKTHSQFYTQSLDKQNITPFKCSQYMKTTQIREASSQNDNESQDKYRNLQKTMSFIECNNKNLKDQVKKLKKMLKNRNSIQKLRHQLIQQLEVALA